MTQVEREGFVKKNRGLTGAINTMENAECLDDNSSMATGRRRSGRSPSLFYFCKKYPPKIRAARTRRSIARKVALRNAITASSSGGVTQLYK